MAWGPSREVARMAELAGKDARTTTWDNLHFVSEATKLNCAREDWRKVKAALPIQGVPKKETWRLLRERGVLEKEEKDTKRVVVMLSSLSPL